MTPWLDICAIDDIPSPGARVVRTGNGDVAVFRTSNDRVFALNDRCPHKNGPLSQGMVHGDRVTCPLHNWVINLADGTAVAPDQGCAAHYPVRTEGGRIFLDLTAQRICPAETAKAG
ncbi:MAG: nitrite reductase small subunit NirD [Rhodospirillales bacterium]|nr:nitrite reductase small subunit NirD [Rhodospirillales bacterium]